LQESSNSVRCVDFNLSAVPRLLDVRDAGLGSLLANIQAMADVLAGHAPGIASARTPKRNHTTLAIAFALVLGAAGSFLWWQPQHFSGATGNAEATFPLETFVVNLAGSNQRAYLRIGITLGLEHPLPTRHQAEDVPTALVRDTILSVLSTAQPEQLLQPEGKRQLKEELLSALQQKVPQIAVKDVYFTEFLVQM
jgi:flagellar basal body-associated protein FliL